MSDNLRAGAVSRTEDASGAAAGCPQSEESAILRAFENASRTTGACFLHRAHIPYHRRPSPVPNATNTTQSHPAAQTTASSTPSLRTSASWKPPGTRNNRFAGKPLQPFRKIAGTFTQFFIFVPNKYRNTQCKLFTTNTTNSWNLPR